MAMTDLTEALFDRVQRKVQQYMHHPFLRACQIRQTVSRFHFDTAWAILQAAGFSAAESQPILEAVLLLHQGLAIHDTVEEHTGTARQLVVLAGDYDSSRYYWVLARSGHPGLLPALCEAVVQINEAKMMLHGDGGSVPPEQARELWVTVHGALLFALADHVGLSNDAKRQVRALVEAFALDAEVRRLRGPRGFSFRQAHEWMADALERYVHLPKHAVVEPLYSLLIDYLVGMKRWMEKQTFAEGNR
ncbi:hypothetical protein GCM10010885_19250 [Alicyclobacillus cellulosilyticus]|uniref:Heptaprenyl diphosphate synthase n=2 Tax=Alicyclobacillus cellulosilyticus TaxID=1003997 RepID=A0A917KDJ1_9BACL|nr:hypothetical protein GCM10010885_19250 [Alicyclobacillus cellulosilyticus]